MGIIWSPKYLGEGDGRKEYVLGYGSYMGYLGYLGERDAVLGFLMSDGINLGYLGDLGDLGYLVREISDRDL